MKSKRIAFGLFALAALVPIIVGLGAIGVACSASLLLLGLVVAGFGSTHAPWRRKASIVGMIFLGPLSLILLLILVLIEQGETIVLRTFDESGSAEDTRLWVVDYDGSPWLGAGGGDTRRWYQRMQVVPEVELDRGDKTNCFRGEPDLDPDVREAVIGLTREKYRLGNLGLAIGNRLGIPMRSGSVAIPVRLVPCKS